MSKTRMVCGILFGLAVACSGGDDPATPSTLFRGTWVSGVDVTRRGTLRLDGTISSENVAGTLTLDAGTPSEVVVQVGGTSRYDIAGRYTVLELSGGGYSFDGVLFGSLSDTVLVGSYTSPTESGSWHTILDDGVVEPTIEAAFALPTGWTVTDLCFASTKLYATATPGGSSPALFEVNPDTGAFEAVVNAPSDPAGIASDGSQFWISSSGEIHAYGSSWNFTGTVATGLPNTPGQLAYQDSAVWFMGSPLPFWEIVQHIAVGGGAPIDTAVEPDRPEGIEFLGDQLWIGRYPAGGEWAKVHQYDVSTGAIVRGVYAPNRSQDLKGGAGPLAAQGTSLWMVSGPGLYRLTVP